MSRKPVFLVGSMQNQIYGGKLPSKRDVLSVLFYNMRMVNLNLHESASLLVSLQNSIELYYKIAFARNREKEFEENLNDLFDIAHDDALILINLDEDKNFLIAQRKKGREGCMLGVDIKGTIAERKKKERREKQSSNFKSVDNFQFISSDSDSSDLCDCLPSTSSTHENVLIDFGPPKSKRGRKEIMSPRLSATLDKCKVSDRDCVHLHRSTKILLFKI
ncbi:Uncharacterized protein FWK35_00027046 [Aphis craccivora]|uniref:Uncharacterized protein n=1 Tax=Aphis craccivora TaxID=307492 RepID=A0A6G0VWR1_APHCR|nr:Uncharacterized protein FWK35_00027046 [Aphis craccivora]